MKKITLDCYTYRPEVYKHFSISKSIDYIPDWWKKLPASSCPVTGQAHSNLTMKSCPGFTDFFKNSYTMPLWSDLKLFAGSDQWGYNSADGISKVEAHDPKQYKGFMPNSQHFKLHTPWKIVCNQPIKWLLVSPTWHDLNVKVLSGMLEFYYQHGANINMFLDRPQETILPLNTPLAHLIPMTEQKVEVKNHLVTEEEWAKFNQPTLSFTKAYYTLKRLINERNSI